MTVTSNSEYNQRESDNLMNIVAVIYGVALTTAISFRPDILLAPVSAPHLIPSLALLAAGLLTANSFYSYVLAIGGDKPYDVAWTVTSSKWFGIIRFVSDLVLASLYVYLLFAAVNIKVGANTKPELSGLILAFALVFAGAVMVRLLRRREVSWIGLIATAVSLSLWGWARSNTATRGTDFVLEVILLVGVLLYGYFGHLFAYRNWKRKMRPVTANGDNLRQMITSVADLVATVAPGAANDAAREKAAALAAAREGAVDKSTLQHFADWALSEVGGATAALAPAVTAATNNILNEASRLTGHRS